MQSVKQNYMYDTSLDHVSNTTSMNTTSIDGKLNILFKILKLFGEVVIIFIVNSGRSTHFHVDSIIIGK